MKNFSIRTIEGNEPMKSKKYELTQLDILALREATEFYWHEISKKVLKNKAISPVSKKMHEAVRDLYEQFKQDFMLM